MVREMVVPCIARLRSLIPDLVPLFPCSLAPLLPCSLAPVFMKLLLIILAVILVAAFVYADYKWRKWIAARRRDRE